MRKKFGWVVGLALVVLVTSLGEIGPIEAKWGPRIGLTWEATSYKGGKLFCYDKFAIEGIDRWHGEKVWVMRGWSSFYGSEIATIDATIRLAEDLSLRVYESGTKTAGMDNSYRVVCEWQQDGYLYSLYQIAGGINELTQRRKISAAKPLLLYNQGVLPQLALLLESGVLSESKACRVLETDQIFKKQNPVLVLTLKEKKAAVIRLPGSNQDLKCRSFVLGGSGEQIYLDEAGKLIALRGAVGSELVVYAGDSRSRQ